MIKEKLLYLTEFLVHLNSSKRAYKIKNEIYNELKISDNVEQCIKSHLHDCGMKGRMYKELLDAYEFEMEKELYFKNKYHK